MNAMIFAAGMGTRLKPITDTLPKALVPVGGIPLLERLIKKLQASDCQNIVINVHHFADKIAEFLSDNHNFGINISLSDEREMLLETGGGIAKATPLIDLTQPLLVHNVDIISTIDLAAFYHTHLSNGAAATLAVSPRKTARNLLFDNNMRLQGWINQTTGELRPRQTAEQITQLQPLAFSGIQVIAPSMLQELSQKRGKFSIIDFYLSIMQTLTIKGVSLPNETIIDVGKLDSLEEANKLIYNT